MLCLFTTSVVSAGAEKDTNNHQIEQGIASWYGERHHGETMANGKPFNMYKLTAAHKTLDFGTMVKVTNIENDKSVMVEITDRGPYVKGRIIDLSKKAFSEIASTSKGVIDVELLIL